METDSISPIEEIKKERRAELVNTDRNDSGKSQEQKPREEWGKMPSKKVKEVQVQIHRCNYLILPIPKECTNVLNSETSKRNIVSSALKMRTGALSVVILALSFDEGTEFKRI